MSNSFLYNFYGKMEHGFLCSLQELNYILQAEAVHNMRKEVKRIRTFCKFLEKSYQFDAKCCMVLENVYKNSGKIRELQVNLMNIKKLGLPADLLFLYGKYLEDKFKSNGILTQKALKRFDYNGFKKIGEKIKSTGKEISKNEIKNKSIQYMIGEKKKIESILLLAHTEKSIHSVRKHFKNLTLISGMLYLLKQIKGLKLVIRGLKKTEELLGVWHDMTVLSGSLRNFLLLQENETGKRLAPIKILLKSLETDAKKSVDDLAEQSSAALLKIEY